MEGVKVKLAEKKKGGKKYIYIYAYIECTLSR